MRIFHPYFLVPYSQNCLYVTSSPLPLFIPYSPFITIGHFFTIANKIWWGPNIPALAVHYSQGSTMSGFIIAGGNCTSQAAGLGHVE